MHITQTHSKIERYSVYMKYTHPLQKQNVNLLLSSTFPVRQSPTYSGHILYGKCTNVGSYTSKSGFFLRNSLLPF